MYVLITLRGCPLSSFVLKGCVFSYVLKVKAFLCILKLFSMYSRKVNVLYVYLKETIPKRERDQKNNIMNKKREDIKKMAYHSIVFSWPNNVYEHYHQLSTLILCTPVDRGFRNRFVGFVLSLCHAYLTDHPSCVFAGIDHLEITLLIH